MRGGPRLFYMLSLSALNVVYEVYFRIRQLQGGEPMPNVRKRLALLWRLCLDLRLVHRCVV